ncbi:MAG: serpin family protein [Anaerolineales bacterium]|nr:serpin family protein [Anaerolineales bacterium]
MKTATFFRIDRLCFWLLCLALLTAGCASGGKVNEPQGKVLQSQIQRVQNPQVAPADAQALAEGNRLFALDFYQAIRAKAGNQFVSPYSISSALAMTYAGARGGTADQMRQVLHFDLPPERLHPAFNALDQQLVSVEKAPAEGEPQTFQLDVANSIWGQAGHPFRQEFLDLLAQNYGAGLRLADFAANAEAARLEINDWVAERTHERIKDLIPSGGVNSATRLVLANAIYFKADWIFPFEKNQTRPQPFTLADGAQVNVDTMEFARPETLAYLAGDGFQAVELPYAGGTTSMLILLPAEGKLETFETGLNGDRLQEILAQAQPTRMQLTLPKFSFTVDYALSDILKEMGMPDAFCTGAADFSGMDEEGNLCIDQVFHKAFVAVDEKRHRSGCRDRRGHDGSVRNDRRVYHRQSGPPVCVHDPPQSERRNPFYGARGRPAPATIDE